MIVLASGSPRRKELLTAMGVAFEVRTSSVDESQIVADHPRTFAIRAAYAKALDVAKDCPDDTWVIGADTIVTKDLVLYGKPRDRKHAEQMLHKLSGNTHHVITAIALARAGSMNVFLESETTEVTFRHLISEEINLYLDTGESLDKAGAYGIQGHGGALIERIIGDYFNVVGFPCSLVARMFEEAGIEMDIRIPETPERWA